MKQLVIGALLAAGAFGTASAHEPALRKHPAWLADVLVHEINPESTQKIPGRDATRASRPEPFHQPPRNRKESS